MSIAPLHSLRARTPLRTPLTLALAAALGVAAASGLVRAATFIVTSSGDSGAGTCTSTCTLRDAITAANANSGADTVMFASNLSGDTILLDIAGKGNIPISDDLTIEGPGANQLTVSGGNVASSQNGGIFNFSGNALVVSGITLANGNTTGTGGALSFGYGTLTLSNVAIQDSYAQTFGGGFYKGSGTLTVTHSTISGNSSANFGGGFSFNYPTVVLVDSTISGNTAGGDGGGFYGRTASGLTVNNSTISDNTSGFEGGGFFLNRTYATLTNSIVANNAAPSGAEFFGATQSAIPSNVAASYNLIKGSYSFNPSGGGLSGTENIFGQDPELGPLTNNGGPTQTRALLAGSPAIDKGDNSTCETTDQRGVPRPYDGDQSGTATCDMGAFEFVPDVIFANGFE